MRLRLYLAVGLCLFAGIKASAQSSIFDVPSLLDPAGAGLHAIAVGDFNGDGKIDLALSDYCPSSGCSSSSPDTVDILLGNGDGTFQAPVSYAVGSNSVVPDVVAVGDFNGDGKLDLAVTNDNSVAILLGNGDGTFQAAVNYGTPGQSSWVAVGDFNGDGKPDLVVMNSTTISVFLNSGTGTFPTRQDFAVGTGLASIVVGDFNGDGKLDLAITGCGNSTSCNDVMVPGYVSILLGNGDGTFQTPVNYLVGVNPWTVAVGDLNGDGFLDLVVTNSNFYLQTAPASVSVLFGNGDGTFQPQQVYPAGFGYSSVVIGDFNGDGKLDFAAIDQSEGTVGVYLNQGGGIFSQPSVFYGVDGEAGIPVAVDFNGDQKLDLAVSCGIGNTGGVCVLLGEGNGAFSQTYLSYPTGSDPDGVAMADLNGDKKNEVAVVNFNDNNVSVFLGNGDGTLQSPVNYNTGNGPTSVAIADVNGDGNPDLIVTNETDNTVSVLLNNGNGTFQTHVDYPTANGPLAVVIGDLNGDGKPDLAVACGTNVSVLFGNGDGTFQTQIYYAAAASGITLGDFNGDGKLDFAVVGSATLNIFLNNGSGGFGSTPISLPSLRRPADSRAAEHNPLRSGIKTRSQSVVSDDLTAMYTTIAAADFNGDGKLDLAVSGGGDSCCNTAGLAVLLGNGDGTFQTPIASTGAYGSSITVADFNEDGIPDVALGNAGFVSLSFGVGNGTFQSPIQYPAASESGGFVAAGDLNGDGKQDLTVASGAVNNLLTVLLNTTPQDFGVFTPPATTPNSVMAGQSATATLTVRSTGGFAGPVALTCSVSSTSALAPTCSLSPAQMQLTAAGQVTTTLTLSTTAATSALISPNVRHGGTLLYAMALPLVGLAVWGVGFAGDGRKKRILGLVICCLLFGGLILQTSCSSGNGGGSTSSKGTPAGNYTVTITGTSGSTQHTASMTLKVQ